MAGADERPISPEEVETLLAILRHAMGRQMPAPSNMEPGEAFDQRLREGRRVSTDRELFEFPPHLREWFDSLSREDTAKINKIIALRPDTIEWISEKNARELKTLDGAVEFISSSRTAAKVLMYVSGVCVAFVGGVVALAKNGYDIFSMLRGGR